jgi:muconate cycloisomerase
MDLPVDLNGRQFVESAYLSTGADITGCMVMITDRPGTGVEVDEALVRKYDAGI